MDQSGFTVWKEANTGLYRWFAFYSNNYRDNDRPSEIISAQSQRTFVEMVDKGVVDYPELWLWHVPVAWGKADWLDYANSFAVASGTVYPGFEYVAENLAKEKNLAVSHGMPKHLILRDASDESVIRFHVTKEISPLPGDRAANKRTGFVLHKGEEIMPLNADKRDWLLNTVKLDAAFVKSLEDTLDAAEASAKASGVESKEVTPAPVAEVPVVVAAPAVAPVVETAAPVEPVAAVEDEAKQKEALYATRQEVADVLTETLPPLMAQLATLSGQVATLTKEISDLKRTDAEKLSHLKEATPPMSLKEMLNKNLIGNSAARIGESDSLSGDKPKEAALQPVYTPTIVPFLNGLVNTAASAK